MTLPVAPLNLKDIFSYDYNLSLGLINLLVFSLIVILGQILYQKGVK